LPEGRIRAGNVKSYTSLLDIVFKKLHSIHEVALCHRNDQINGVEVFLTIKAPCQICFMIGGRMKIVAKRATEPEYFLMIAHLKIQQIDNNLIDGDVITQSAEKIGRVIL
jgi:hypothetical protein